MGVPRLNFRKLRTVPLNRRTSKVHRAALAQPTLPGEPVGRFLQAAIPPILAGQEFRDLVQWLVQGRTHQQSLILMLGAHVIKCGLAPLLIELLRRRVITAIATNGAVPIHDFELAQSGHTSEEVGETLLDGTFGMARETGRWLNGVARWAAAKRLGLGQAIGERLLADRCPYLAQSLFAQTVSLGIPITVHVAIGTDIVAQHPQCDGGAWGTASYRDFHILSSHVASLRKGGAVLNWGSAVILPEVFLKALAVARNLGYPAYGFATANFDMVPHYRPLTNVVKRPTQSPRGQPVGRGFTFLGHHELLFPLFYQGVIEAMAARGLTRFPPGPQGSVFKVHRRRVTKDR